MELDRPQMRMKEILDRLALAVRQLGFKGSGQNFRKVDGEFIFVINFQKGKGGQEFFINLGAQPKLIPTEGGNLPDAKKIKEYECAFRIRLGNGYHWTIGKDKTEELAKTLTCTQNDFFVRMQRLPQALETDSTELLLRDFCIGTTYARATLHLARACVAFGQREKAKQFVQRGFELVGERAATLRAQLKAVLN